MNDERNDRKTGLNEFNEIMKGINKELKTKFTRIYNAEFKRCYEYTRNMVANNKYGVTQSLGIIWTDLLKLGRVRNIETWTLLLGKVLGSYLGTIEGMVLNKFPITIFGRENDILQMN